ncbi:hypothetical protein Y032_0221g2554 [Ancylostoma ceylanicum]|uniref:Prenyltransferase alpha-alpha toroid domain-containing protein n=1 Tax=Ancylostoma ceylanicum TaxID=53326 RepID=A0A016SIU9_9BILA|nr:hypothetical protein Y032_0221g2554 [Ancylostoma ceylanicum]
MSYIQGLDASRTWMCFWGLHSLNILGAVSSHQQKAEIIAFLKACQHPDGGYGGEVQGDNKVFGHTLQLIKILVD